MGNQQRRSLETEEKRSQKRREVRREEKCEERRLEPEMSGDYSDGEGSGGPYADFVDPTAVSEMELRLPLEVDMKPDQLREDVPAYFGSR